MNCPSCKNPVQANANECEWCGSEIVPQNDVVLFKTVDFWEKLEDNNNSKLVTCNHCKRQGYISCYGKFLCSCGKEVFMTQFQTICPHCKKTNLLHPDIYKNTKIKILICGVCKNKFQNPRYIKTGWF